MNKITPTILEQTAQWLVEQSITDGDNTLVEAANVLVDRHNVLYPDLAPLGKYGYYQTR